MRNHEFELDQEEKDILDAFEADELESEWTPERAATVAQWAKAMVRKINYSKPIHQGGSL